TLEKALQPEFKEYGAQVLKNAKSLAETLMAGGLKLITDGTDNHMMVADTSASFGIGGTEAEQTLDKVEITVNKQVIPDDPNPPLKPSGIRLGTPAATTRGMKEEDMNKIGNWMLEALKNKDDEAKLTLIREEVEAFCSQFPVPGL
ncbi:MAG: serine hydroxymethyltransferase, partial [Candidatus Gracilibacteria bacterium]|nr:serine hydroxymethyltransferase [Candidatus Gracilibacteria bacterium]